MIHRRGKALIVLLFLVFFLNGCDLLNISPEEKNMAPEITGDSYVVFNVGDDVPDWKDFIQATDEEDGIIRITDSMIEDNDIDLKNGGLFEVDVYVSDSDGKTSLFTINVEVIDNIAPVITLIGDEIIHINKGDFYFDLGVSVVENSAYYDIDVSQVVDVNTPGEYVIEYYAIDGGDNVSNILTRTVFVHNNIPEVEVVNTTVDYHTIQLDYIFIDLDDIGSITNLELVLDGIVVDTITDSSIVDFVDLKSGTTYDVRINYTYSIEIENQEVFETYTTTLTTKAYEIPVVAVAFIEATHNTISYGLKIDDVDQVIHQYYVHLLQNGVVVETIQGEHNGVFASLLGNTEYELQIVVEYLIDDEIQTITYDKTFVAEEYIEVLYFDFESDMSRSWKFYSGYEGSVYFEDSFMKVKYSSSGDYSGYNSLYYTEFELEDNKNYVVVFNAKANKDITIGFNVLTEEYDPGSVFVLTPNFEEYSHFFNTNLNRFTRFRFDLGQVDKYYLHAEIHMDNFTVYEVVQTPNKFSINTLQTPEPEVSICNEIYNQENDTLDYSLCIQDDGQYIIDINVAEYIDGTFIENIGFNSVDTRYRIENVTDNKALTLKLIYSFNMNNNENDSNVTKDFDYNTVEVDIFTDPSFDEEVNTEWIMENYMGDSNTFFNEDGKLRVDVFDPGVNFFDVYMIREGLAFETGVNYMLEFEVFTTIDRKIKLSFRNDASVQTLGDLVLFGTDLGPTVVAYYFTYELSTISRLSIFLGTFDEYENNGTIYFDNFKVTKTDE